MEFPVIAILSEWLVSDSGLCFFASRLKILSIGENLF